MPRSWKTPGSLSRGLRVAASITASAGLLLAAAGSARAVQQNQYDLLTTINVTASTDVSCATRSTNLQKFDISWTAAADALYLLADRTNCSLDVFDTIGNTELFAVGGFSGQQATPATSGPDGVLVVQNRFAYVGNGDSTVRIIDLLKQTQIDSVSTVRNGELNDNRADEMVWDPRDNLVMVANDSPGTALVPTIPYVSFISTTPDNTGHHNVVGRIDFPDACNNPTAPTVCGGIEQSVWSKQTGLIYISIPAIGSSQTSGEIAAINPRTRTIVGAFPVSCQPAGLAIGPSLQAIVGCSDASTSKGVQIINLKNGSRINIGGGSNQLNGADEVWFNPSTDQYFVAAGSAKNAGNSAQPVLGVIDASGHNVTQVITTNAGDHSVAADPVSNHVFLPDTNGGTNGAVDVFHLLGEAVAQK